METKEFLGLVLGIICVAVLIFFGVKLYSHFTDGGLKDAQVFVDDLKGKIDNLKNGQDNTFDLRVLSGWVLVGWSKETPLASGDDIVSKDRKPQRCLGINCLCLCEGQVSKCAEKNYCVDIDRGVDVISIYGPKEEDTEYCYIMPETSNLIEFDIRKEKDSVLITVFPSERLAC